MDTWWIDEPRLLGSCNPTTRDLEKLRDQGFSVIVSLLEEDLQRPKYDPARAAAMGYSRHNIAVRDFQPPKVEQLQQFVELLDQVPRDRRVILHCQAGVGRTGTFGVAYWISKGLTVDDALARVRRAQPAAVETPAQRAILDEFARMLASREAMNRK